MNFFSFIAKQTLFLKLKMSFLSYGLRAKAPNQLVGTVYLS